jgi:uracil-DNA glycosylase
MEVRLASPTDIAGFRSQARHLLAHQVPPDDVTWCAPAHADDVPSPSGDAARPRPAARAATSIVPASFVRLCEYVVQHRDADRFALLYRLLWRLVHEPGLRHDTTDADMVRAQHMAHAVRRDIHKVKTHLHFRDVQDPENPAHPLKLAWCEPAHHVVETVAPWLARKFPACRWALMTPELSASWDGRALRYAATGPGGALSATMPESAWLARWKAVFPAG